VGDFSYPHVPTGGSETVGPGEGDAQGVVAGT
jgi:hypothetical protein